jgi:hypothetical protein
MQTHPTPPKSEYSTGYADGRHAAKERVPADENPHPRGSARFHGWNDGHYDERSSRFVQMQRHSAELWSHDR